MWQKTKHLKEHAEILNEIARHEHRNRVFLELDRAFASAWPYLIASDDVKIKAQLPEYESLLREGVETQWGLCEFIFNREDKTISVYAKDGRAMELISGRPLEIKP